MYRSMVEPLCQLSTNCRIRNELIPVPAALLFEQEQIWSKQECLELVLVNTYCICYTIKYLNQLFFVGTQTITLTEYLNKCIYFLCFIRSYL